VIALPIKLTHTIQPSTSNTQIPNPNPTMILSSAFISLDRLPSPHHRLIRVKSALVPFA
jgi:hypothetical protein